MIGIDIINIDRFAKIAREDFSRWDAVFTQSEWEYGFNKPNPAATLAGIYAAKEAAMKSVGGELMKRVDRIEVCYLPDGKPIVKIDKKTQSTIYLSISHTEDVAAAVAISYER